MRCSQDFFLAEFGPGLVVYIQGDVKLAQLVRARDCQSRGGRFNSGKNWKNRELK